MSDALDMALQLQAGLRAWFASDRYLRGSHPTRNPRLQRAFRNCWDDRIGAEKFGGVWSIYKARTNPRHPVSTEALKIVRNDWTGKTVTVEHAIPVNVLFRFFWDAETPNAMEVLIDAYAVAVVTKEEDERLNALGLRDAMPVSWRLGDEPLARWKLADIEVPMIRATDQ